MSGKRVCKVRLLQVKGIDYGGYKIRGRVRVYRVVECEPRQKGYLNEKGVRLIWQSGPLSWRDAAWDLEQRAEAKRIASAGNRALAVGLEPGTPEGIVADREQEVTA